MNIALFVQCWPDADVPNFRENVTSIYQHLSSLGLRVLSVMAIGLQLVSHIFALSCISKQMTFITFSFHTSFQCLSRNVQIQPRQSFENKFHYIQLQYHCHIIIKIEKEKRKKPNRNKFDMLTTFRELHLGNCPNEWLKLKRSIYRVQSTFSCINSVDAKSKYHTVSALRIIKI